MYIIDVHTIFQMNTFQPGGNVNQPQQPGQYPQPNQLNQMRPPQPNMPGQGANIGGNDLTHVLKKAAYYSLT